MGKPTVEEQLELARRMCPDLVLVTSEEVELRRIRAEIAEEALREVFGNLVEINKWAT